MEDVEKRLEALEKLVEKLSKIVCGLVGLFGNLPELLLKEVKGMEGIEIVNDIKRKTKGVKRSGKNS